MGRELPRQLVEQFRMARRIVLAHVVGRLDQAGAEEVSPELVDGGPGEVGIVGRGDPLGQGRPRAAARLQLRSDAGYEPSLNHLLRARNGELLAIRFPLRTQVSEERGEFPELLAGPMRRRMVVALGALQLETQEEPGSASRQVLRLLFVG